MRELDLKYDLHILTAAHNRHMAEMLRKGVQHRETVTYESMAKLGGFDAPYRVKLKRHTNCKVCRELSARVDLLLQKRYGRRPKVFLESEFEMAVIPPVTPPT